jgi:myo-inositol 2-dehydrogenase / D-chiro-inositol 1-dehydrogenase
VEPVRLGIVGLGAVAQLVYVPLLARRPDLFRVVALADLSPGLRSSTGARLGVPEQHRFADVDSMLDAGRLDAVIVLTSGSHGAIAKAIADAGIPAFVEKPLAWTLAELDALRGHEAIVQVGYMKRFDPAVQRLQRLLAQDEPVVRSAEVVVLHPSTARQVAYWRGGLDTAADVPQEVRQRLRSESAAVVETALGPDAGRLGDVYWDVLLGSLIHDLAVLRPLVGDPVAVDWATVWPGDWTLDRLSVAAECSLAGGARLSLRWHYAEEYPEYRETVSVHAETGSYQLGFSVPYVLNLPTALTVTRGVDEDAETSTYRPRAASFEQQLEAFHAVAAVGEKPVIGIDEARADVVTCQRIAAAIAASSGVVLGGEAAAGRSER